MAKSTKAEHRKRINQVAAMLATGSPRADIIEFSRDRWHVTSHATDKYIAEATKEIREAAETTREDDVANARAVYALLLREQIGSRDYRGAATTTEKLCKLLGLDAPTKITDGDGNPPFKVVIGIDPDDV